MSLTLSAKKRQRYRMLSLVQLDSNKFVSTKYGDHRGEKASQLPFPELLESVSNPHRGQWLYLLMVPSAGRRLDITHSDRRRVGFLLSVYRERVEMSGGSYDSDSGVDGYPHGTDVVDENDDGDARTVALVMRVMMVTKVN